MSGLATRSGSWAGLVLGPGAWLVNTQANLSAVPWVCAHRVNLVVGTSVVLALVALVGALLSWRAYRATPTREDGGQGGAPRHLLAFMSALMAAFFALLILTQGAASLVLTGCER